MKIKEFLSKNKLTWQQFADMADVSRQTIWFIIAGNHTPTLRTIDKIVSASKGAITIDDLRHTRQQPTN